MKAKDILRSTEGRVGVRDDMGGEGRVRGRRGQGESGGAGTDYKYRPMTSEAARGLLACCCRGRLVPRELRPRLTPGCFWLSGPSDVPYMAAHLPRLGLEIEARLESCARSASRAHRELSLVRWPCQLASAQRRVGSCPRPCIGHPTHLLSAVLLPASAPHATTRRQ